MKKVVRSLPLAMIIVGMVIPMSEAGNIKKVYINVSKDGTLAQASDIPSGYGQIETELAKVGYDFNGGHHGMIKGTPLVQSQKNFGKALNFQGTGNSYMDVADVIPFEQYNAITAEAWIKPTDVSDWGAIVARWKNGLTPDGRTFGIFLSGNGRITAYAWFNGGTYGGWSTPTGIIKPNEFQHVAMTASAGGKLKIYVNGEKIAESTTLPTGTLYKVNQVPLRIGAHADGGDTSSWDMFKGTIDDVRLWNKERTQEEIKSNMNKEMKGNEAGLVGYWNFN